MQFKQIKIYQLPKGFKLTREQLVEKLTPLQFNQCLPSLPFSYGWVSPYMEENTSLVHELERCLLFSMQIEEKILPGAVIRQELISQVKQIEGEREKRMSVKEKQGLKDQVVQTLLPRAFSKYSAVYAYFDFKNHWLIVNSTSKTKLDKFNELIKRSLPELTVNQLINKQLISMLTNWLFANKLPKELHLTNKLVLKDPQQKQHIIRLNHTEPEILPLEKLFKQGFKVFQLGLSLDHALEFSINDDNTISGIRFNDEIKQEARDQYGETALSRLNADFYLTITSFSQLINITINQEEQQPAAVAA